MVLCSASAHSSWLWLTKTTAIITRIHCSPRCDCLLPGHAAMREKPWKDAAWHDGKGLVVPDSKVHNAVSCLQQPCRRSTLGRYILIGHHACVTKPIWRRMWYNLLHPCQSTRCLEKASLKAEGKKATSSGCRPTMSDAACSFPACGPSHSASSKAAWMWSGSAFAAFACES